MIEQWFDQINLFLHTHPYWMSKLAFLFRLKCGLLTLLAGYFLFLIYREKADQPTQPGRHPGRHKEKAPAKFVA